MVGIISVVSAAIRIGVDAGISMSRIKCKSTNLFQIGWLTWLCHNHLTSGPNKDKFFAIWCHMLGSTHFKVVAMIDKTALQKRFYFSEPSCLNWSLNQEVSIVWSPVRAVMNDRSKTGGWRFDPHQGRLRVALQPILNGGDLCFVNCAANIVSYYYGWAVWWQVLSCYLV